MRKAVYFFCTDYERDEVAPRVLNYLKENYDLKLVDFKFANMNIMMIEVIYFHLLKLTKF